MGTGPSLTAEESGLRWEIGRGGGEQVLAIARPVLECLWQELEVREAGVAAEWEADADVGGHLATKGFEVIEHPRRRGLGPVRLTVGRLSLGKHASTLGSLLDVLARAFSPGAGEEPPLSTTIELRTATVTLEVRPAPAVEIAFAAGALSDGVKGMLIEDVRKMAREKAIEVQFLESTSGAG